MSSTPKSVRFKSPTDSNSASGSIKACEYVGIELLLKVLPIQAAELELQDQLTNQFLFIRHRQGTNKSANSPRSRRSAYGSKSFSF